MGGAVTVTVTGLLPLVSAQPVSRPWADRVRPAEGVLWGGAGSLGEGRMRLTGRSPSTAGCCLARDCSALGRLPALLAHYQEVKGVLS